MEYSPLRLSVGAGVSIPLGERVSIGIRSRGVGVRPRRCEIDGTSCPRRDQPRSIGWVCHSAAVHSEYLRLVVTDEAAPVDAFALCVDLHRTRELGVFGVVDDYVGTNP